MVVAALGLLKYTTTLEQCTDFSTTVAPYLPQIKSFFSDFLRSATTSTASLQKFYVDSNPLLTAFCFSLAIAPIFLAVSEVNKNYSQIDRCWSILPAAYAVHYASWAHAAGLPTARVDLIAAVVVVWGSRLTFNYWRKGGYTIGSEDYRWQVLREYISPGLFILFNIVFISLLQSVLLFFITTPIYPLLLAGRVTGDTLTQADKVFAVGILSMVGLSALADQQQWDYQETKKKYLSSKKPPPHCPYPTSSLSRGFNTHGLWAYSRHPNFAAEQGFWLLLYQWCCFETFTYYNWTGFGALAYLALFQASTWFTELLTIKKYAEYEEYQNRVSRFLPKVTTFLTGPVPADDEDGSGQGKAKGKKGETNGTTKGRPKKQK